MLHVIACIWNLIKNIKKDPLLEIIFDSIVLYCFSFNGEMSIHIKYYYNVLKVPVAGNHFFPIRNSHRRKYPKITCTAKLNRTYF